MLFSDNFILIPFLSLTSHLLLFIKIAFLISFRNNNGIEFKKVFALNKELLPSNIIRWKYEWYGYSGL